MDEKTFFLIFGILFSNGFSAFLDPSNTKQMNKEIEKAVSTFLEARCRANVTTALLYRHDFFDYYNSPFLKLPEQKDQFCSDEKLKENMRGLSKDVQPCFLKEEKYLSEFMFESWKSFLKFACSLKGKNMHIFYSPQGVDCRHTLNSTSAGPKIDTCFTDLVYVLRKTLKKPVLCRALATARKCFGDVIVEHCYGYAAFEQLNYNFFDAISQPCNSAYKNVDFSLIFIMFTIIRFYCKI